MIIEKLPEIANAVAQPLAKTEKIVIVDQGGNSEGQKGAAKVTGYVTDIVSQLPETIGAMTGFNFMDALKGKLESSNYKKAAEDAVQKSGVENVTYQTADPVVEDMDTTEL